MEAQRFPIFPRVIGLVCVAFGLLGLAGDIYTFTQPVMVTAFPAWVHIVGVLTDILFLAGGMGIILKKRPLYLLTMVNSLIYVLYTVASWRLVPWEKLITASSYQLPEKAISAGIVIAKVMAVFTGIFIPLAFLAVLAFYYGRINRNIWR